MTNTSSHQDAARLRKILNLAAAFSVFCAREDRAVSSVDLAGWPTSSRALLAQAANVRFPSEETWAGLCRHVAAREEVRNEVRKTGNPFAGIGPRRTA